jgi:hypothetical protein
LIALRWLPASLDNCHQVRSELIAPFRFLERRRKKRFQFAIVQLLERVRQILREHIPVRGSPDGLVDRRLWRRTLACLRRDAIPSRCRREQIWCRGLSAVAWHSDDHADTNGLKQAVEASATGGPVTAAKVRTDAPRKGTYVIAARLVGAHLREGTTSRHKAPKPAAAPKFGFMSSGMSSGRSWGIYVEYGNGGLTPACSR